MSTCCNILKCPLVATVATHALLQILGPTAVDLFVALGTYDHPARDRDLLPAHRSLLWEGLERRSVFQDDGVRSADLPYLDDAFLHGLSALQGREHQREKQ